MAIAAVPIALVQVSAAFALIAVLVVGAALVVAVIDYRATPVPETVRVTRSAEPQLSIGVGNPVALRLRNPSGRPIRATLRDTVPVSFDVDRRTAWLEVGPESDGEIRYAARPRHRGTFRFGDIHLRLRGPPGHVHSRTPFFHAYSRPTARNPMKRNISTSVVPPKPGAANTVAQGNR